MVTVAASFRVPVVPPAHPAELFPKAAVMERRMATAITNRLAVFSSESAGGNGL